jgi:hypothetical protein
VVPETLDIHLLVDSYATHNTALVQRGSPSVRGISALHAEGRVRINLVER